DRVGSDNFLLFGLDADQAVAIRGDGYHPREYYERDGELKAAVDAIASGVFSGGDPGTFAVVVDAMLGHDEYLVLADYRSYLACQAAVDAAWRDADRWTRMSVLNPARSGYFSADRTVADYCASIWRVTPVRVSRQ